MKRVMIVTLGFLLLFLISCTTIEEPVENETIEIEQEEIVLEEVPQVCDAQWVCFDEDHRIYQYENCTKVTKQECDFGCEDGKCKERVCTEGLKCRGDYAKGYLMTNCKWRDVEDCPFGCKDAECEPEPVEEQPQEEDEEQEVESNILNNGDTLTVEVNEKRYNVSIYAIENGRVKMTIDDDRTQWINTGESAIYQDLNFTVTEILFQVQGYQQVSYLIG